MPASDRLFFLCTGQCVAYKDLYKFPRSHIMGELRYLTDEGRRVTALALYEVPVSAAEVPPLRPVIIVHIIGDARMIRCRFANCTKSQRWEIGQAGIKALMDRMGLLEKYEKREEAVK